MSTNPNGGPDNGQNGTWKRGKIYELICYLRLVRRWHRHQRLTTDPVAGCSPRLSSARRTSFPGSCPETMWQVVKPYLLLGLTSAITGVLIVAINGDALTDYRAAILAGYVWDSTLRN